MLGPLMLTKLKLRMKAPPVNQRRSEHRVKAPSGPCCMCLMCTSWS